MQQPNHVITKIDKITNALIFIITQARKELVLVSPYLQLQYTTTKKWKEFDKALNGALDRGVEVTFVARNKDEYHRKDIMNVLKEWREKGCSVYLLQNLHAKVYYSESLAMVTSMNLYLGSTVKNHEIAVIVDKPNELEAIRFYMEELKDECVKESIDGQRVVTKVKAPSGQKETWFKVTNLGSKYAHVRIEGKYQTMILLRDVKARLEKGKSYCCHANVKWRTIRGGKKRVYLEDIINVYLK